MANQQGDRHTPRNKSNQRTHLAYLLGVNMLSARPPPLPNSKRGLGPNGSSQNDNGALLRPS
eukprot:8447486-Pyramimonas_sp.AAC.1